MRPWKETIEEALAIKELRSDKYSERRSAFRKAFAICLEGTHKNWSDSAFIENKWQAGTWRHHTKMTRFSASGIAACFGNPLSLLVQMVALHVINNSADESYEVWVGSDAYVWDVALFDHGSCAPATRGDGRSYGLHSNWDACWQSSEGQTETFIDWAVDFAHTNWGLSLDNPSMPQSSADEQNDTDDKPVTPAIRQALDTLLASTDLPSLDEIETMQGAVLSLGQENDTLRKKLANAGSTTSGPVAVAGDGTIPSGKVVMRNAADVFDVPGDEAKHFDFDVPFGEWDGRHPHIPAMDEDYVFVINSLVPVLLAIVNGRIPWLKGHTGTGKTTLIEQVYARLNLPLFRLNLDSDITRGELVGREVLRTDSDGNTVTEFVEGVIPMAMQQPCGLLLDEIDASRPDLGFVLQRLTEGKGFMLLEDGGRTIMPHPHFRMFATANTNGRGDETGLYSGTRALGTAFVNRFKPYIEVEYMTEAEEAQLLEEKVPALEGDMARSIAAYATEHRVAFKQADVTLACSPRDTLSFAMAVVDYKRTMGFNKAIDTTRLAFEHSILNAADSDDRQVLEGLMARVFKAGE